MRRLLIVASIVAVLAAPAAASRWVLVVAADSANHFIDADALVWDGPVAAIWLRTEYLAKGQKGEAVVLEKWMHDCENARAKLLALTLYKADGAVIRSAEAPRYDVDWSELKLGSTNEAVHQKICEQRPRGERG